MPRDPGPQHNGMPAARDATAIEPAGVVVPLRSFTDGKARLASRLDATQRAQLVRDMANRVVDAAGDRAVVVVSNAPEVVAWAADRGLDVAADPGSLDAAATAGVSHLARLGCERAVVSHADLPFATTFDHVASDGAEPTVALVPCHRNDGTPVISVPIGRPFVFSYGPGSFARHCEEARRLGLAVRVVHDEALAFDVDIAADLERLTLPVHAQP
jgi:2-phospho-L-lactate/phosphoenolpyruvate guanylyltransferase